jgi:glucan phosphoethanolaminetransferase (alkaline phosphatase superfamily)
VLVQSLRTGRIGSAVQFSGVLLVLIFGNLWASCYGILVCAENEVPPSLCRNNVSMSLHDLEIKVCLQATRANENLLTKRTKKSVCNQYLPTSAIYFEISY